MRVLEAVKIALFDSTRIPSSTFSLDILELTATKISVVVVAFTRGTKVGPTEGIDDGFDDGFILASTDGVVEGEALGFVVGLTKGEVEGDVLGLALGPAEGEVEGDVLGLAEGETEGVTVAHLVLQFCGQKNLTVFLVPAGLFLQLSLMGAQVEQFFPGLPLYSKPS